MSFKKDLKAERMDKAKNGGYAGGKPPFGYKVFQHQLVIDEAEASVVRTVLTARHRKITYAEILDLLIESGYRNSKGNLPHLSFLQRICDNEPLYYGYYRYGNGKWVEGQQEPIMTDGKLNRKKLTK